MLHHRSDHGQRSDKNLSRPDGLLTSPEGRQSISQDGSAKETTVRGSADGFELEDLSQSRHDAEKEDDDFDSEFDDWASDHGRDTDPLSHRRTSASTIQSFMLYTPDEEKSVIKKFDRRLVLFVAFLYMLSFLDRSSMCISDLLQILTTDIARYWKC